MVSKQSQRVKAWLYKNVKNGPAAASVQEARHNMAALEKIQVLPPEARIESVHEEKFSGKQVSWGRVFVNRTILYLHGGGYILGLNKPSLGFAAVLSKASECPIFALDYRLAPEDPFPAALEDALAAYHWLLEKGIRPEDIAFVGDSAGGGLALATLIALRDAREKLPAAAALICPWTDLAGTGESIQTNAACDPFFNLDSIEANSAPLYAGEYDLRHPLISPLYAELHDLPTMLIHAAADDILLDDSTRLLTRGKAAGLEITMEIWEEMWHVWHMYAGSVPEGREATIKIGEFLKQKLDHGSEGCII